MLDNDDDVLSVDEIFDNYFISEEYRCAWWRIKEFIGEAYPETKKSTMVPCDCKSKCHKVCDIVACDACGKEWRD